MNRNERKRLQQQMNAIQQNLIARQSSDWTKDLVSKPKAQSKPKPKRETPVFSECVIGYRIWKIDALGRLRPLSVDARPWVPGVNLAKCDVDRTQNFWGYGYDTPKRAPKNHKAPHHDCQCGLYSRFSLDETQRREGVHADHDLDAIVTPWVVGAVAGWGDLQVHRDGMRAEKACVVALAIQDEMPDEVKDLVLRVADTYRVAAVPMDLLEMEASQHGTPLPDSAKPEPPKPVADPWMWGSTLTYLWTPSTVTGGYITYGSSSTSANGKR